MGSCLYSPCSESFPCLKQDALHDPQRLQIGPSNPLGKNTKGYLWFYLRARSSDKVPWIAPVCPHMVNRAFALYTWLFMNSHDFCPCKCVTLHSYLTLSMEQKQNKSRTQQMICWTLRVLCFLTIAGMEATMLHSSLTCYH